MSSDLKRRFDVYAQEIYTYLIPFICDDLQNQRTTFHQKGNPDIRSKTLINDSSVHYIDYLFPPTTFGNNQILYDLIKTYLSENDY